MWKNILYTPIYNIQYTWLFLGLQQPSDEAMLQGEGSRNQGRINIKLQTVKEPFLLGSLQHQLDFYPFFYLIYCDFM